MDEEAKELLREIRDLMRQQVAEEKAEMQRAEQFRQEATAAQVKHVRRQQLLQLFLLAVLAFVVLYLMGFIPMGR